jgi:ABC-type Zn uptake system ZnuABC Zn-binding protein ZnuA
MPTPSGTVEPEKKESKMKRTAFLLILLAALGSGRIAFAADRLRAVTSIPDLADIARRVGGDFVEVTSVATGVEDIHAVPMKPSFAVVLNRADVVIVLGLQAEHAFMPALLEAARNPKILPGATGYIDCSTSILPLEVPTVIDRAQGEQHPMGNPHFNLDPVMGKDIARAIAEGLARNDPSHEDVFKKNLEAYLALLDGNIARWEREMAPLKGVKLVSYHPDLLYFCARFGMEAVGTIELKAGVGPTPRHVEELEERMRKEGVRIVVRERHFPAGLAETVAQRTGAKLVELPVMVGGVPEAKDYVSFIDYNVHAMLRAVQGG